MSSVHFMRHVTSEITHLIKYATDNMNKTSGEM